MRRTALAILWVLTTSTMAVAEDAAADAAEAAAQADDAATQSADETAIRTAIKSYVDAFNKADAAAVAGHWGESGEFTTPSGQTFKGRAALEKEFSAYFAETKGARLEIAEPELQFISPSVAVERGTATVVAPDTEPTVTQYEAVHVRQAGGWKMDSVREAEDVAPQSHYEHLKELQWMIGQWVDQDETTTIETACEWTKNQNFITRSFKVSVQDRIDIEGTQVIGWDPIRQTIRSWVFDTEGGFGVGSWSRNGDKWTVRSLQVLADGSQASSINTLTYVDENTFLFKSTGREIDGQWQPNIEEVTVVRK